MWRKHGFAFEATFVALLKITIFYNHIANDYEHFCEKYFLHGSFELRKKVGKGFQLLNPIKSCQKHSCAN